MTINPQHTASAPYSLRTPSGEALDGTYETLEGAVSAAERLGKPIGVMGTKRIFGCAMLCFVRLVEPA